MKNFTVRETEKLLMLVEGYEEMGEEMGGFEDDEQALIDVLKRKLRD